jgi:SAM-dependent methyltransferase
MLEAAREFGIPNSSLLAHFDGLSIPLRDSSVDIVWVSSVLKYTLFPPGSRCLHGLDQLSTRMRFEPTYSQIAREMYRVLKPGGLAASFEFYVDEAPAVFTSGFEQAGFVTECARILRRDGGRLETFVERRNPFRLSPQITLLFAKACAELRYQLDNPEPVDGGLRDYLFVWRKL